MKKKTLLYIHLLDAMYTVFNKPPPNLLKDKFLTPSITFQPDFNNNSTTNEAL